MVAQDSQPLLAVNSRALVNALEDRLPLPSMGMLVGRYAAVCLNAAPIECIATVEKVVWLGLCGSQRHLLGNTELRPFICRIHVAPHVPAEGRVVCRCDVLEGLRWPVVAIVPWHDAAPVADDKHNVRAGTLEACGLQLNAVVLGACQRHRRCHEARMASDSVSLPSLVRLLRLRLAGPLHLCIPADLLTFGTAYGHALMEAR
mmetsp:Transcript_105693/g.256751  ORF Transcript_105693/g.256751 Transcript_105693/m.256751 type:complete len:203 (-) Transcript_105693:183-791(-)